MRSWHVLLLFFLAGTAAAESIESRLIRTIQIGVPQQITADEILAYANDSETGYTGHVLARSALVRIGQDRGFPDWPLTRLLDRSLTQLQRYTHHIRMPEDIPRGFGGEHLIATLTYALVMSGQQDEAVKILARHSQSRSNFKRAVALQALRYIGSREADDIIQAAAEARGQDNYVDNLLADHHYPFLYELYDRRDLVPPEKRDRRSLLELTGEGCSETAAMATYLLGFFSNDDGNAEAEVDRLRELSVLPCFYTRFFARRALALRSHESSDFWIGLYSKEHDAWQRAQLVRILLAHYGKEALPVTLELLKTEPSQYVQWELMHGNIELREGADWRGYWDIWLTPTLQFRLDHYGASGQLPDEDMGILLSWLESGAVPKDKVVRNHLLYALGRSASGPYARRLLGVFNKLDDRQDNWWILATVNDPGILPILYYWRRQGDDERQTLTGIINRLETRRKDHGPSGTGACCQPTRECLEEHLATDVNPEITFNNEKQVTEWLQGGTAQTSRRIDFKDALQRIAVVTRAEGKPTEEWQHLFGCWRQVH